VPDVEGPSVLPVPSEERPLSWIPAVPETCSSILAVRAGLSRVMPASIEIPRHRPPGSRRLQPGWRQSGQVRGWPVLAARPRNGCNHDALQSSHQSDPEKPYGHYTGFFNPDHQKLTTMRGGHACTFWHSAHPKIRRMSGVLRRPPQEWRHYGRCPSSEIIGVPSRRIPAPTRGCSFAPAGRSYVTRY
jgi:hypothetical protein